jgi:hypothetical protein
VTLDEVFAHPEAWARLERLRGVFLGREKSAGAAPVYWRDERDLELYDKTFARRIACKWDAVLAKVGEDLARVGPREWLDWGVGSAVASERMREFSLLDKAQVWDHSAVARSYASVKLRALGVGHVGVSDRDQTSYEGLGVLVSHVINEMSSGDLGRFLDRLRTAEAVIWVEAGSKASSRRLSECREILLKKSSGFQVWSPCTHAGACGILAQPERGGDWCHFFADVPSEFHQSPFWRDFSRRLGVDLRSIPYSVLVLARSERPAAATVESHRVLGTPRVYKGYLKVQSCHGREGVQEYILEKRADKGLFKKLSNPPSMALADFQISGNKILAGELK